MASETMEALESTDTLASLEQRITRAVQIIGELRSENEALRGKLAKADEQTAAFRAQREEAQALSEEFQKENGELEERTRRQAEELETLRDERKQVKSRIEKLLSQLDLLSAS